MSTQTDQRLSSFLLFFSLQFHFVVVEEEKRIKSVEKNRLIELSKQINNNKDKNEEYQKL
ncbi:hypothetical protein BLOT_014279 [Blomia tropicalis]|nr:hypothetical protein BLOT_014279 [Blomia tropicalis]